MLRFKQTTVRIGLLAIILVVFYQFGWIKPLQRGVERILQPITSRIYSERDITKSSAGLSYSELQLAYEQLSDDFHQRTIEVGHIAFLENENAELRGLLNFSVSNTRNIVGADIIGKSVDPFGSVLFINQGSHQGIKEGNPVVAENGALVGVVISTEPQTAQVRRIDDNRSKIAATIFSEDKSIGVVEGLHGISLQMNFIPQNERIDIGDIVISSGLQEHISRGIAIGTVLSVEKEPYEPFQQADITPLVQIDKLSIVGVITEQPVVIPL